MLNDAALRPRLHTVRRWVGVCAIMVWAWCSGVRAQSPVASDESGQVVSLTQAQVASGGSTVGQEGAQLTPPPAEAYRPVNLPDPWWAARPPRADSAWYRLAVERPAGVPAPLAIYIEQACSHLDVQFNGQTVFTHGDALRGLSRHCRYPQLITLPDGLWRAQGNQLDLRVRSGGPQRVAGLARAGALSVVQLGPLATLAERHRRASLVSVDLAAMAGVVSATLGGLLILLGWRRRRDSPVWAFGAVLLCWAALTLLPLWRYPGMVGNVIELLLCSLAAPLVAFASLFLLWAADLRSRVLEQVLVVQCALLPVSLLLAGPANLHLLSSLWHGLLGAELLAAMALNLWATWLQRRGSFKVTAPLLVGLALSLLAEPAARLADRVLPPAPVHLVLTALLLAWGAYLISGFARALQTSETARGELESRMSAVQKEIDQQQTELTELRIQRERAQRHRRQGADREGQLAETERQLTLAAEAQLERVTAQERKRIAADLHDDLGAKLLTIVHTSESDQISSLAREALEEMRLSVRGLTGKPVHLTDALADWRSETVARLSQANIEIDWRGLNEDTPQLLAARSLVQTTRILRESISNIIKHSGASQCKVRCGIREQEFGLVIQDNGNGISMELDGKLDRGHGMASMKNRAKQMQGQCLVESGPGYGTVIRLTIPL
jgi:two-component system, NarL family, sensor histidine kinase UhpB